MKSYDQLSILKSRDITLPTKVHLVKAMVFPVVMYGCENWALKKAEHWRIDAFELWLEKVLESPLDCKGIKPVHPKGDQLWIFIGRTDAEDAFSYCPWGSQGRNRRGYRGWGGWMASPTQWTWVWVSSGSWWWTGNPGMLQSIGLQRVWHVWVTELKW